MERGQGGARYIGVALRFAADRDRSNFVAVQKSSLLASLFDLLLDDAFADLGDVGGLHGSLIRSTGHVASRTTRSATLPSKYRSVVTAMRIGLPLGWDPVSGERSTYEGT